MTPPTPAELLVQLTDAEKVALTGGEDAWTTTPIPRLGIPSLRVGDGPHGVRKPHEGSALSMFDSHPATCFPTAVALGASWDPDLVREVGVALGREAASHDIAVLLGPGVNLKRTPVGGRNFEYFSEDPLLSAALGSAWVRGVQSTGVGASLKHFAANNTERRRYGIDAVVDERALRELYLASFETVVREARPATVMAAYNRLNGEHCSENAALLTGILREEWGFEGLVVSDWGAAWDRTVSIPAGNDLAMPGLGPLDDRYVRFALRTGALPAAALDATVLRILGLVERHAAVAAAPTPEVDLDAHHELARRASVAGTVLLSNDGVLPLAPGTRLAVIGALAAEPRFQGAGSSHVVPTRVDPLLGSLRQLLPDETVPYAPGYDRVGNDSTPEQLADAVRLAGDADVAIVVVGLPETYETEGVDREHLRLPEAHDALVEAVVAANPRTVVVLQNGSPVELPWAGSVPAVLEGYLGGQAGGSALAAVLLGLEEPGGRLAETFPERYADHPVAALPIGPTTAEYRESLYVGYRWFDSAGEPVAFPFGHGLSYTRFVWDDVRVEGAEALSAPGALAAPDALEAPDAGITLALTVTNTGERRGVEVLQLYVHAAGSSVFRPEQELRAFAKVELDAGESRRVTLRLPRSAFRFWDAEAHAWAIEPGRFELRLGRSSRDIGWTGSIDLAGDSAPRPRRPVPEPYAAPSRATGFPAASFERLLGRPLPPNDAPRPGRFTLDSALGDLQGTLLGRLLQGFARRQAVKTLGAPAGDEVDAIAG
ncbi:MAG: glycoside hydrolase family 3 C-terminal domain-containing protein, partial [Herbiconiux sp.]|nr:glycoside hydrolase family 3 C-terminal domain-containing protein [Herbiconiux sp.]